MRIYHRTGGLVHPSRTENEPGMDGVVLRSRSLEPKMRDERKITSMENVAMASNEANIQDGKEN